MDVQFINTEEWGIDPKGFQVYIKRLKKHVPKVDGVLNVIFVSDEYIQSLNKSYRKKNKPTDVLSFSYLETPEFKETQLIGEIYISVETAKRQAEEYETSLEDEFYKLFTHGFLHIFGYDHIEDEDYRKMHKIECEVLDRELPFVKNTD